MAIELPREFKNVPLILLWGQLRIALELQELAEDADERAYWAGWNDAIAVLFSDLTQKPTTSQRPALAHKYKDFKMEEELLRLETELRDENGGL